MEHGEYQLTIDKIFKAALHNNPDQVISYQGKERYTYREFYERVRKLAAGLLKIGVEKGDRVAVIDWDTNRFLEAYYAIPMIGAVLHTVNIRYPPEMIFYTMQHAADKYVIVRDEFVPILSSNKSAFDFIKGWVIYSEYGNFPDDLEPKYNYDDLLKNDGLKEFPEVEENDLATTFYPSGTTGLPNGVEFTHRQIVLHALSASASLADEPINMKSSDVLMPLVPMFHVHSWGMPYMTLIRGMKYVLPGRYDVPTILKVMAEEKVSVSAMVPSILYMLISHPDAPKYLKDLDLKVIVGGGALPKGLADKAAQLGIKTISGYGMSETAPILTLATYNKAVLEMSDEMKVEFHTKTGIPIPLVELRVVDRQGNEVPRDSKTIGEIIVRTPWLTNKYVGNPEGTEKLWKNDWLNTGDLAVIDEHGYIAIVDRERDAVKSGGEFIPTLILEDLISTCPGVSEVAVVGRKDEKWGERPVAFVSGTGECSREKIVEYLETYLKTGRIAKFWIPDEFIKVESFEKTSTGKIDKKVLREIIKQKYP